MGVARFDAKFMLDLDQAAIAALPPSFFHHTVGGCIDGQAIGPGEIGARLYAAVTARLIDAAGRSSDQPDFGVVPESIHRDQPVSYQGYLVSGDALATDTLLAPQQWNDLNEPALALSGILTEIQFNKYLDQLRAQ